jgi:hypothetical protein
MSVTNEEKAELLEPVEDECIEFEIYLDSTVYDLQDFRESKHTTQDK